MANIEFQGVSPAVLARDYARLASVATVTPEQFGAVGDGTTDDKTAMQAMWDAVPDKGTVVLAKGKTYAQSGHCTVNGKSLTVIAYGATVKMLAGSYTDSYTWLAVNRTGSGIGAGSNWIDYFRWYGGLLDGNGTNQAFTDSAHNSLGNTGLVGVWWAKDALASGVRVTGAVSEGVCFSGCQFAKFSDCHGYDCIPLLGGGGGLQGTMFKVHFDVSVPNTVGIWRGCTAWKGSIAFHAQSGAGITGSRAHFDNCHALDMSQDDFHIEAAERFTLNGCSAVSTDTTLYEAQIQSTPGTKFFSINGCEVIGGNIWTPNTGALLHGVISNTRVDDHRTGTSSYAIDIGGSNGKVIGCTVSSTTRSGINAETVTDTKVLNVVSGGVMIIDAATVTDCDLGDVANQSTVDYTVPAISNFKGGNIRGVRVYGVHSLVQTTGGKTYITDCEAINTGRSAVMVDSGSVLVKIRGGLFLNNGADNTQGNQRRAAIGGSTANVGAQSTTLDVSGVAIRNDGTVATAYTQALYWNDTAGHTLYWSVSDLVGMTTPDTYTPGGGVKVLATTAYTAPTGLTGATAPSRYVGGTTYGPPTSGTFAVGDFVIDESGIIYICTSAGTPGTWVTAKATDPLAKALGYGNWNYALHLASSQAAATVGTVYAVSLWIPPGRTVSSLQFACSGAAAGTTPGTGISYGLAKPDGTLLAQTDPSTSFTSSGIKSLNLQGAYTSTPTDSATGLYFACVLQPVAWGSTQPTLTRVGGGAGAFAKGGNPLAYATGATTGQSALPANASAVAGGLSATNAVAFWCAWS